MTRPDAVRASTACRVLDLDARRSCWRRATAPTGPSTCDRSRHRADDEVGAAARSARRAFRLPAVTSDRAVGLGDEAAAVDVQLGTGLGHDRGRCRSCSTIRRRAITRQPKPGRDRPGCDHATRRARRQARLCAIARCCTARVSATNSRRTPCGSRAAISAGSTTMTASNSRPLASAAGHDHERMVGRHLAGLGEHDAARLERGAQLGDVRVVGDHRDRRHLLGRARTRARRPRRRARRPRSGGRRVGRRRAHRARRRDVGGRERQQPVGEVEDRARAAGSRS